MKKATVTVSFEQEKLKAVQFYAGKNGTSLELELDMFRFTSPTMYILLFSPVSLVFDTALRITSCS